MLKEPSLPATGVLESSDHLRVTLFRRACHLLDPAGYLELALLLMSDTTTANESGHNSKLAAAVAERVRLDWDRASNNVQIQYVHFPGYDEALVLYSKPFAGNLLVLVAPNNVLLGTLRRIADSLVCVLNEGDAQPSRSKTVTVESFFKFGATMNGTYAIAWQPVEALPRAVRNVIGKSAERLARRIGCQLNFLGVASDHVHLVLQCPPRRTGSWAAYVFKHGIEEDLALRYGTRAMLWKKGFLAESSSQPIAGDALLAYLSN